MFRLLAACIVALGGLVALAVTPAAARGVVGCSSQHNRYHECSSDFRRAVIVRQESDSPCVYGQSWGFDRDSGTIWVDHGCRAVFADAGGYRYDRRYSRDYGQDDEGSYYGRWRHPAEPQWVYPPDGGPYDEQDCQYDGDC
jgi:hypothetical protein